VLKLKKIPWLSIILLLLTYSSFGWIFARSISWWIQWFLENDSWFGLTLSEPVVFFTLKIIGLILVLFISLILTTPLRFFNYLFGTWLQSDTKALLSVLGFAFAAVLIACWLEQFVRLLILTSAAMLFRFELQRNGYPQWLRKLLLGSLSLISFLTGLILYQMINT